jgi:TRAP-type mannitol/chloroaromatic compound transport system permease small subunit
MFSAIFLLCGGLRAEASNEHIRIDVVDRSLLGSCPELDRCVWLPRLFVANGGPDGITYVSWPVFMNAWHSGEISSRIPAGLIRWPVRLLLPVGFVLLILQADLRT